MGKSWKTTATGILAIIAAVSGAIQSFISGAPVDWTTVIAAVMAGIGLITAKDSTVVN